MEDGDSEGTGCWLTTSASAAERVIARADVEHFPRLGLWSARRVSIWWVTLDNFTDRLEAKNFRDDDV